MSFSRPLPGERARSRRGFRDSLGRFREMLGGISRPPRRIARDARGYLATSSADFTRWLGASRDLFGGFHEMVGSISRPPWRISRDGRRYLATCSEDFAKWIRKDGRSPRDLTASPLDLDSSAGSGRGSEIRQRAVACFSKKTATAALLTRPSATPITRS